MPEYSASIEIAAPPPVVFPFIHEPDRLRLWAEGFVRSEPLTSGPVGVGTRSIDIFTEGGREIRMETEITAFEPGRRIEVAIKMGGMTAVSDYTLEGDTQTRVTHHQTVTLTGLMKLMTPFIGGVIRKRITSDLARLKAAVEG